MNGPAAHVSAMWPRVRVDVDDDGQLAVQAEGQSWPSAASATSGGSDQASAFRRGDLPRVVAQVAEELGSPIRVEVHDSGRTYAEVVLPAVLQETTGDDRSRATLPSVLANGDAPSGFPPHMQPFTSGEPVSIAVVVATTQADADGEVRLRIPAALRGRAIGLLAYGQHSAQARYLTQAPGTDQRVSSAPAAEAPSSRPAQAESLSSGSMADPLHPASDVELFDETGLADDEQVGTP